MHDYRYTQLDVFSPERFLGNPLAVVHDDEGRLDADRMAAFARWTQMSETTFLLPPTDTEADYRVRIFTPGRELPFAGHPTLGSCRAWLEAGGVPRHRDHIIQECGAGRVIIRRDGDRLLFGAPPCNISLPDEALVADVQRALGLTAAQVQAVAWLDNGPKFLTFYLDSAERVLHLKPDHAALRHLAWVAVAGAHPAGASEAIEVRTFIAMDGIEEDPVTGSLNAALAGWLIAQGRVPKRYVAAQGTCLGKRGRVWVEQDGDTLWVGGHALPCVTGTVRL